ncbi:hypothetical protein BDV95DRAFT_83354 [Massariosphaeria phaeospora]|uniref:Uncharacterized protein n=1 Tax=Massariosphaeria phaeospora TaxID=100035 RepID=A0A7C8I370_9PLEO|nr:hypothetical protein BDV95DRAFT_83354 [Massariosphaeria phaeospora]
MSPRSGVAYSTVAANDRSIGFSIINVLATAIPEDVLSVALASPTAFAEQVQSQIAGGSAPSWYQALPTEVKSYLPQLYPVETPVETPEASSEAETSVAIETLTTSAAPLTSILPSVSGALTTGASRNATVISTVTTATLASTGGANSDSPSASSASATGTDAPGAAAHPTAFFGAGVAGAVGILGMLAL